MINIKIAAAIGFIATALYLLEFFLFATAFRKHSAELWASYGRPERFGIYGQTVFLQIALGMKKLPADTEKRYLKRFVRMRILLVIGLGAFLYLAWSTSLQPA